MIMDVVTDALSPSAMAPNTVSHPANLIAGISYPSQIALECLHQSPEKGCLDRHLFYHRCHYDIYNHPRGCGQLFRPPSASDMAVYVEFSSSRLSVSTGTRRWDLVFLDIRCHKCIDRRLGHRHSHTCCLVLHPSVRSALNRIVQHLNVSATEYTRP